MTAGVTLNKRLAFVFAAWLFATTTAPALFAQESSTKSSPEADNSTEGAEGVEIGRPIRTIDPVIPNSLRDQVVAVVLSGT